MKAPIVIHSHAKEFKFNEKIMSALFATMPVYVAIVAADGCVVYANDGFLRLMGLVRDDIEKGKLNGYNITWTGLDGKKVEKSEMPFVRVISTGKPITSEIYSLEIPGKGPVYFSLNGSPYFAKNGGVIGAVFVITDVDHMVKADRKLKETVDELSTFSHTLAHDMKTPLHTIVGYVELIQQRHGNELSGEARELMGFVISAAKRAYTLQNDLMTYLKIGRLPVISGKTELNPLVDEVINNIMSVLMDSGKEAHFSHSSLPAVMSANSHMYELFQNLIENGVKFVRPGITPEVTVGYMRKDGLCLFSVKDNGIGIAPEYAGKLFNIFQRLHGEGEYPGTGIGLVVCKKIVSIYGGTIWFESAPGAGTTFFFTLPEALVC